MTWVMVDVESDGPVPGDYSMISFGAVIIDDQLNNNFYGQLKPISDNWMPEALAISGFTREETLEFEDPEKVMKDFGSWLGQLKNRPMFISDNNGYDWMFICWYFHHFTGKNPFGFSSTNLGSLYKGCVHDLRKNFKHLRKTKHTHNPVDDATGNAEAFISILKTFKL